MEPEEERPTLKARKRAIQLPKLVIPSTSKADDDADSKSDSSPPIKKGKFLSVKEVKARSVSPQTSTKGVHLIAVARPPFNTDDKNELFPMLKRISPNSDDYRLSESKETAPSDLATDQDREINDLKMKLRDSEQEKVALEAELTESQQKIGFLENYVAALNAELNESRKTGVILQNRVAALESEKNDPEKKNVLTPTIIIHQDQSRNDEEMVASGDARVQLMAVSSPDSFQPLMSLGSPDSRPGSESPSLSVQSGGCSRESTPVADSTSDLRHPPGILSDDDEMELREAAYTALLPAGERNNIYGKPKIYGLPIVCTYPGESFENFVKSIPWNKVIEQFDEPGSKDFICLNCAGKQNKGKILLGKFNRENLRFHVLCDYGLRMFCPKGCKNNRGGYTSYNGLKYHFDTAKDHETTHEDD